MLLLPLLILQARSESRTFDMSRRYIILAVDDTAPEVAITVKIDNKAVVTINVRCAISKITSKFPIDLSRWSGKSVTLEFASEVPADAQFWKNLEATDTFVAQFDEKYRPKYHFAAKYGWINDPNGMFYADGRYHFHFQYNPYGAVWGNMHWGHAVSKDMLTWEYLPYSLAPDELGGIFSGSSIVDTRGKSKFGAGSVLSYYTSAGTHQQQSLAVSKDNGFTWEKYEGNPIIPNTKLPDFRDPKVIEYAEGQFVMCLAVQQHIEFWGSSNLVEWTKLSEFGEGYGAHGGVWECPDLMYFKDVDKWVLIVNINPGGYAGGSAAQYFVVTFDGRVFHCEQPAEDVKWLDFGKDSYAIVTFSGVPDGRIIGMPWMSNWDYANVVPSQHFRGSMGVPRVFSVKKVADSEYRLASHPIRELTQIRKSSRSVADVSVDHAEVTLDLSVPEQSEVHVSVRPRTDGLVVMELANSKGQKFVLSLNTSTATYTINRFGTTNSSSWTDKWGGDSVASLPKTKDTYRWTLFVDSASIEFFDEDGLCPMTNLIFPDEPLTRITFRADDFAFDVVNVTVYSLNQTMYNKDAEVPSKDDGKKGGLSGGAIFGIVLVVLILVAGGAALGWFFWKRSNDSRARSTMDEGLNNQAF